VFQGKSARQAAHRSNPGMPGLPHKVQRQGSSQAMAARRIRLTTIKPFG
jgi:hypothetical protein